MTRVREVKGKGNFWTLTYFAKRKCFGVLFERRGLYKIQKSFLF